MPSIFSKSLSKSAVTRLRSAHAFKAMLRDSLNLHAPSLEDEVQPTDVPSLTIPDSPFVDDDDLSSLEWPRDGFEDIDLDEDDTQCYTRQRCDSAATIKPEPRASPSKKKSKRSSSNHRVASGESRRSLKRSHSSRNLLPELGEDGSVEKQNVDDSEPDWSEDMPGINFTASTRADGVTTLNFPKASGTPACTSAGVEDFAHLSEFIVHEEYSAKMLDGLYNSIFAGIRVRQRFDLSINFKTRHVELWDVANFKYAASPSSTSDTYNPDIVPSLLQDSTRR